jgi:hypothetical protein
MSRLKFKLRKLTNRLKCKLRIMTESQCKVKRNKSLSKINSSNLSILRKKQI